ncbi:hypothetical protein [Salisaeta longa]|uniref:hypothetical protein n=1 Tax=Salisaeta longa TaxID=503170 RepID=UPI0003B68BC2|nr:hypothetical protein [Salisaeta longa]
MTTPRTITLFSAECPLYEAAEARVRALACDDCTIRMHDVHDDAVTQRAADLGVRSIPAVAVNGALVSCCTGRGLNDDALRAAGIGQPLS